MRGINTERRAGGRLFRGSLRGPHRLRKKAGRDWRKTKREPKDLTGRGRRWRGEGGKRRERKEGRWVVGKV